MILLNRYPENELAESDSEISSFLIKKNQELFYNLTNLPINHYSITDYITDIETLLENDTLSEEEVNYINERKGQISSLYEYIIGNNYYPQIVFNEKIGRTFFHPLFNWKSLWVENLFQKYKFIDLENYKLIKFDINSAVPRAFISYISKRENSKELHDFSIIGDEFYNQLYNRIHISEMDNNKLKEFKRKFLIFLNDDSKDLSYLSKEGDIRDYNFLKLLEKYKNIMTTKNIGNYTNLMIMKNIFRFIKNNGGFNNVIIPLLNYDGGYAVILNGNEIVNNVRFFVVEELS